jgi:hypothetical protein
MSATEQLTPEKYISALPPERQEAMQKLRGVILKNTPKGFTEIMTTGMIAYVVPKSTYPAGYHCNPQQALPFVCIASQKNFISLYHMGVYAMPELLKWFESEYPKHSKTRLDMGKSCIRFKKPDQIPFELIGQLMKKVTVKDWIDVYERNLNRR